MVRKRSPYADIPSLYDMYVQAAPRDREPERFGWSLPQWNQTRDALPMDLPVGPDYVVGPGDGLAINLWGGVSQRMVRQWIAKAESICRKPDRYWSVGGPWEKFRNRCSRSCGPSSRFSADVSLSRLRTIRVYVVGEVDEPGAYDISSLSTPLNALFAAGGMTQRGSLRN